MIIQRYLARQVSRPFAGALATLVVLFASFSVAALLAQAASGLLPAATIARLVLLKVIIALEVLIPIALYVSVFLALGRLYRDAEVTAMLALRISPRQVSGAVLAVSLALATIVGALSLVARPWAYRQLHRLTAEDAAAIDLHALEAGTFYVGDDGRRVIYVGARTSGAAPAQDVFVLRRLPTFTEITHGALAAATGTSPTDATVQVRDARIWRLSTDATPDELLAAGAMTVDARQTIHPAADTSAIASSTPRLLATRGADAAAELQWRLSTPLSTILLGMLGLLMSRPRRQQGGALRMALMIVIYFCYDLLFTSARTWVQHGTIGTVPGVWWVPALLGLFLVGALYRPGRNTGWRRA